MQKGLCDDAEAVLLSFGVKIEKLPLDRMFLM